MKPIRFLIAAAAIVSSLSSSAQTYQLQGVVRDSVTQWGLENVTVEVLGQSGATSYFASVTDIKGRYCVALPAGSYKIHLRILGYNPATSSLLLSGDSQHDFVLSPQSIPLGEILVSSLRVNRKVRELPTPMAVVNAIDYQKQSAQTLSNVLAAEPGIAMGGDGVWATNINIRGLNENRLVTLVDGNRVETATDLTAALSMIDVNDIDRVEIIKGAQSSLYGTGAMGGIVNIITKDGYFSGKTGVSGTALSGFATANKLKVGHLGINTGGKSWYVRVSGSYNAANDIRTPNGQLPNSQYQANNVSAKFGMKPFRNHQLSLQFQRYWANDVGIPGGSAFPGPAEATYTDIGRQLLSASYEIQEISNKLTSLRISYFNQYILRDVAMIPNTTTQTTLPNGNTQLTTPELFTPIGKHLTNGLQFQTNWNFGSRNTLIAGIDTWSRKLTTERTKKIRVEVINPSGTVVATNNLVRGETPIPESRFTTGGLFVQDEARLLNNNLRLIVGGRIDGVWVSNEQGYDIDYLIVNGVRNDTPPNQRITFAKGTDNGISWSANAGLLYVLLKDIEASVNLSRSFRSPSLEERFKYIDLGNLVRLGDPNLNPESGYSVDMGIRLWKPRFTLQASVFNTWLTNMIVETPGEFTYTINTGPSQGTTATLPALINANVSKAKLYGMDIKFQYNVASGVTLFGSGAYLRGKDTHSDTDLPQIPPMNGRLGVRLTHTKLGAVEVFAVGAAKQDKIASGEHETGGYARYDMAFSTAKFNLGLSKLQLFAGVDNLTDRAYTNHLATNRGAISIEPGRNVYLRLSLSF